MAQTGLGSTITHATITGDIVEISGPNPSRDTIDATHLGSTAKEFLFALVDNGEVTITAQYTSVPAMDGDATAVVITLSVGQSPGGQILTFDGGITGYNITGVTEDGIVTIEITIKVTGDIAET